jgi:hypothetical protein
MDVYRENRAKYLRAPCGQNAEFLNVNAGVMYGYHCAGAAHLLAFLKF